MSQTNTTPDKKNKEMPQGIDHTQEQECQNNRPIRNGTHVRMRSYHSLPVIAMFYVTSLIVANIAAFKIIQIGPLIFPGGLVIFPLSYIFDNILTEVYGYQYSRRIIWTGLLCIWLFCLVGNVTTFLPAASFWPYQGAYALVMSSVPRMIAASSVSYLISEFLNSYVLAKLKVAFAGKYYWFRLLASTAVGGAIDSLLFCVIAFAFTLPWPSLFALIFWQWVVKIGYEILAIPLTYRITSYLKRVEHEDHYDYDTNFNPFRLKLER